MKITLKYKELPTVFYSARLYCKCFLIKFYNFFRNSFSIEQLWPIAFASKVNKKFTEIRILPRGRFNQTYLQGGKNIRSLFFFPYANYITFCDILLTVYSPNLSAGKRGGLDFLNGGVSKKGEWFFFRGAWGFSERKIIMCFASLQFLNVSNLWTKNVSWLKRTHQFLSFKFANKIVKLGKLPENSPCII